MWNSQWSGWYPLRWIFRVFQRRTRRFHQILPGVPAGIDLEILSTVAERHLNIAIDHVSFRQLDSWNNAVYRIFLFSKHGKRDTLIYKDACYTRNRSPALIDFPQFPGLPEYIIYRMARGALARYLPEIYWSREIEPEQYYQYIMEDLARDYRPVVSWKDELRAVREIPSIQRAIGEWTRLPEPTHFLAYDRNFYLMLQGFARRNLETYLQSTNDRNVKKLLKVWPAIIEIQGREDVFNLQTVVPLHGDYSSGNIFLHRQDPSRIKIIDWEWAGFGVAQADLADLLKSASSLTVQRALELYTSMAGSLRLAEHRLLYFTAGLEKGLMNAALAAALVNVGGRGDYYQPLVQAATRQALNAFQALDELA